MTERTPGGEVVVYETTDGGVRVEVRLDHDTVWLTQRQMADLFDTSTDNIGLHVKDNFSVKELDEHATTEDFSVVQVERRRRVRRQIKHYNLDAIISVGYRVNSRRGVRFRQEVALSWLEQTDWAASHVATVAPGEPAVERENFGQAGHTCSLCDALLPKRVSEELRVQALGPLLRESA
jgi:hypothetical protein